jgi:hypothetical protein
MQGLDKATFTPDFLGQLQGLGQVRMLIDVEHAPHVVVFQVIVSVPIGLIVGLACSGRWRDSRRSTARQPACRSSTCTRRFLNSC